MLKKEVEAQLDAMSSKYHNLKGNHARVLSENKKLKAASKVEMSKGASIIIEELKKGILTKDVTIEGLREEVDQRRKLLIKKASNFKEFASLNWWQRLLYSREQLLEVYKDGI